MPTNNLHSLDALLLSVRDTESKRLTQEAVTAYQAGAYRAAILSIWVAVCADIISKLRELATGGDAAALAEVSSLETWVRTKDLKNLQNFENGLVELAGVKFEMLLPHERTDLERLQDDRHLCAHPAFVSDEALFSPTPELARAHITHAILHLLSRPPVQGKQLISRYDRDLQGGSFPNKADEIELVLRQNYLARAKPGSVVNMIKALAKALVGDEAAKYEGREDQIAFSLAAIGRIAPGPLEEYLPPLVERLGRELDDGKVLALCTYIEPESRIWDWLGQAGQTRILAKIDNASFSDLVSVITPRHGLFATIKPGIRLGPVTKARHVAVVGERLLKRLKQGDQKILEAVISRAPCLSFVGEALTLYSASHSFAVAEKRGAEILLPHAKYFAAGDIQKLNTIIRENVYDQILHASQTATILTQVFDETRPLLPAAALHWSEIAEYVVTKKAAGDYGYPEFLAKLKEGGIKVPDLPQEDTTIP
jgi:hypothetical protein